jgi:hypothetical protein
MQEARYALYFCKEFYERYKKAVEDENNREQHKIVLQVFNSPKPKHLASFLVRAKAFYTRVSMIDKPMHIEEKADIDLMQFISERMTEMREKADVRIKINTESKYTNIAKLEAKSGLQYFCPKCERETKKELEYCAMCGKRQIMFPPTHVRSRYERDRRQHICIYNIWFYVYLSLFISRQLTSFFFFLIFHIPHYSTMSLRFYDLMFRSDKPFREIPPDQVERGLMLAEDPWQQVRDQEAAEAAAEAAEDEEEEEEEEEDDGF